MVSFVQGKPYAESNFSHLTLYDQITFFSLQLSERQKNKKARAAYRSKVMCVS